MSAWLCYLIGAEYLLAAILKFNSSTTEQDYWVATMLFMYAVASVALGKIT